MQWFVVKYRKPDGTIKEAEFEASDKTALFKILAEKKISAIGVASGRLGIKRAHKPASKGQLSGGHKSVCILGFVVVVSLLAVVFFVCSTHSQRDMNPSHEEENKKPTTIPAYKAVKGVHGSMPDGIVGTSDEETCGLSKRSEVITNDGPIKAGDPLWREKGYAHPRKPRVFKSASDQILSMIADIAEGKDVPPIPIDKHFEKEFLESLKIPIEILDDDSERIVKMKNSVNQLRQELSERAEGGESAYAIIREFEKTMAENYKIRSEIQEEVRKILEEGDRKGAKEYLAQMNQALCRMGIKEVEMPMTAAEKAEFVQKFRQEEAKRRAAKESETSKENHQ